MRPTHGRWPKVAAAAAPAVSLAWLAARRRLDGDAAARWAILPALLWHQTEEWFWPGGFLEWFNREVLESPEELAPLTPADAVVINLPVGWGTAVAAGAIGERLPALPIAVMTMHAANAALHTGLGVARARYNPGMASSITLFAPMAANGLVRLVGDRRASRRQRAAGVALGLGVSFGMARVMDGRAAALRRGQSA